MATSEREKFRYRVNNLNFRFDDREMKQLNRVANHYNMDKHELIRVLIKREDLRINTK